MHARLLTVARAHAWEAARPTTVLWSIYRRDGWCCQMPGCTSIGPLDARHVWWRSAGGPDEAWNLLSLCEPCHRMVHAKKVVILPGKVPEDHVFMTGLPPDGRCTEAYRNGQRIDTARLDWRRAWSTIGPMQAA